MTDLAVKYNQQGYSCSQCILKAFEEKYGFTIDSKCLEMCSGLSAGFGVGGMCGAVISGIMVFSLLFDEETVKRLRIKLLAEVDEKYGSLNCSTLRGECCEGLISSIATIIEEIIVCEISIVK